MPHRDDAKIPESIQQKLIAFERHLDACGHCRRNPSDLCETGRKRWREAQGEFNVTVVEAGGGSDCCGAPVKVEGDGRERTVTTNYYVCTLCEKPCDVRASEAGGGE